MYDTIMEYALPALATGLGLLLTWLVSALHTWAKAQVAEKEDAAKVQEILDALFEGITKAQDEIVTQAKKDAADGKLTTEEITAARDLAITHAKSILTGDVKDLFLSWSKIKVYALITQLVQKYKA